MLNKKSQIGVFSKICGRGACMSLGVYVYSKQLSFAANKKGPLLTK